MYAENNKELNGNEETVDTKGKIKHAFLPAESIRQDAEKSNVEENASNDTKKGMKQSKKSHRNQHKHISFANFNLSKLSCAYKKIETRYKVAFYSSLIIGLLVHIYKFTNTLRNHDAVFNSYNNQNMVAQGRWFLSIACGFSSYFDLPWVIGILSLILIAVSTCLIVNIFNMENYTLIILTAGLLVSFPAVTEIFEFEFTADGYMIAMFFTTLAVYLSKLGKRKVWHITVATICVCLSCAIYQALLSFGLVLATCYFLLHLLENKHKAKECLLFIKNQAIIYVVGVGLYYVIWKLLLKFAYGNLQLPAYKGLNTVGSIGASTILNGIYTSIKNFVKFFICDFLNHTITPYAVLNTIFIVFGLAILIFTFIKSKIYKNIFNTVFFFLALLAIPFFEYILIFASSDGAEIYPVVGSRAEIGMCILYIFIAVLIFKYAKVYSINLSVLLFACIIFNNGISANITYYQMNLRNEEAYAVATELASRIHQLDDGTIKYIALVPVGVNLNDEHPADSDYINPSSDKVAYSKIISPKYLLYNRGRICIYLSNFLDFQLEYYKNHPEEKTRELNANALGTVAIPADWTYRFPYTDYKETNELAATDEVKNMNTYPYANSIKVIGDTVVVKLADY